MVHISSTDNPEASLDAWLDDPANQGKLLAVEYDYVQYYLPEEPVIRLLAVYFYSGEGVLFTVMASEAELKRHLSFMDECSGSFDDFVQKHHLPLYKLGQPLMLETVSIAKPWGQEVWYTGIEERGVSRVSDGSERAPLPWVLSAAPRRLSANRERQINLLKILDPLPEEVFGDLYFELHEEKREVYVVTHVDERAWPNGVGAIRYGFDADVRKTFPSEQAFRDAYLDAVNQYQHLRTEIDKELDRCRQLEGVSPSDPVSSDLMKRWISRLPSVVVERERSLREKMNRFTSLVPLKQGDVIKVPLLTPHSLQHGVRTVEFQTPVYERMILSFAQKVLTQKHWDTERAVNVMSVESAPIPDLTLLENTVEYQLEEVVRFDDFQVRRLTLSAGSHYNLLPYGAYGLLMVVDGEIDCQDLTVATEQALFLPAHRLKLSLLNKGQSKAVVLLAAPL